MNIDQFSLNKLPKDTYEITLVVPWTEIDTLKKQVVKEAAKDAEIKGFRKGKAPEDLVAGSLDPKKVLELALEKVIPDYYREAIEKFSLKPIISPKIELLSSEENKDWRFKFTTCGAPDIQLNDYKEKLKGSGGAKIWTPGTGQNPKENADDKEKREKRLEEVFAWFDENINAEISDLLIEDEVNHKLSNLLQETQKLGLSIDQYLASSHKTVEEIKNEYRRQSEKSLKMEFILGKITEEEKITVSPEEIEKTLADIKDEKERKQLEGQKYYLAMLLRQQKTLDFLANL